MPVASRGFFVTIIAGVMIGASVGFYLKDKEEIKGLVRAFYMFNIMWSTAEYGLSR